MNSQKVEADELRQKVSKAAQAAIQADTDISEQLTKCLQEEREQAAQDRQDLLSQITILVNKSSEIQDSRWESKVKAVRDDIVTSASALTAADKDYSTNMDIWSKKETLLADEVLKSRDTLKSKMKEDWKSINEHNTNIQTTTKSVHEETIRIVDAQMKDVATQMQALDDFVTRARSQNERHHSTHVQSLQGLASTVNESYCSMGDHFVSTYDRVCEIGNDISSQSSSLSASLPPLAQTIQQPLMDLRISITDAPLKEYVPTGETPRRQQYQYPTTLPRTLPHDKLVGKTSASVSNSSPQRSPSKAVIYTDAPAPNRAASASPSKDHNPTGLREISLNVNASLTRTASDTAVPTTGKTDPQSAGMGPPPLKRQATESKLPQKFGGGKAGVVRLEGRENMAPGAGRRLRNSPAG